MLGEVYVLDDGGEVDLDLGNYERFLDVTLHRDNNITTGKIYKQVIEKEREGHYLGKTVQGEFFFILAACINGCRLAIFFNQNQKSNLKNSILFIFLKIKKKQHSKKPSLAKFCFLLL